MGNKIVLCIDDEEIILNSLEMDLSAPGEEYQIELATNGLEALELLEELVEEGHDLAVVISDYIMPEMKGDELLIKIHENFPSAAKILLTGQSQIEGVTNAINNASLYRYIAKPWQKEDLKLTLKSALQKYRSDELLREKEQIITEMNNKLQENQDTLPENQDSDEETYSPDNKLSDEELYDQIYYSRFYQSLNSQEKKWFALASIGLINADKKLTKSEMNYLNSIVRSDREKDVVEWYVSLIKQKSKPNLDSLVISNEQKYRFLTYLAQIIISAKRVGQAETEYFNYICTQMGVNQKITNDCLKIINHKIAGNYMGFKLREHLEKTDPLLMS